MNKGSRTNQWPHLGSGAIHFFVMRPYLPQALPSQLLSSKAIAWVPHSGKKELVRTLLVDFGLRLSPLPKFPWMAQTSKMLPLNIPNSPLPSGQTSIVFCQLCQLLPSHPVFPHKCFPK